MVLLQNPNTNNLTIAAWYPLLREYILCRGQRLANTEAQLIDVIASNNQWWLELNDITVRAISTYDDSRKLQVINDKLGEVGMRQDFAIFRSLHKFNALE